ncbi:MAG: hypothetical protein ABL949_04340 [Fimbriimonadaceae bacterium]
MQLAIVGSRLLSLYFFVRLIAYAPALFTIFPDDKGQIPFMFARPFAAILASCILQAAICYVTWDKAPWIAKLISRECSAEPANQSLRLPQTVFAATGMLVFLTEAPTCVEKYYAAYGKESSHFVGSTESFWAHVLALVIALYFTLGSSRIVATLRGFWNPSVSEEPDLSSK